MAKAFPNSEFYGFDYHPDSIEEARQYANDEGVSDRVHFDVATAKTLPDHQYGLICFFDCLHDLGDPVGVCQTRQAGIEQQWQPDAGGTVCR